MLDNTNNRTGMPWMSKGRWYKFFIEADGNAYYLTTSDIEGAAITSNYLKLPSGFHILQIVGDAHSIDEGTASTAMVTRYFADDCQGCILPNKNAFSHADVWIFAYKGE